MGTDVVALAEYLDWHDRARNELDWAEVEGECGFAFPRDYKALLEHFPSGGFCQRFYIKSPVENRDSFNRYQRRREILARWYHEVRDCYSRTGMPYSMYPGEGGLILWGEGDDTIFYWRSDPAHDPDVWPIVVANKDFSDWEEHFRSTTRFLYELVTGELTSRLLSYKPVDDERGYYL